MKKHILSALLAMAMMLALTATLAIGALAATPSATLTGPDSVEAGKEFSLSFTATEGVYGFMAGLSYDQNQLELVSATTDPTFQMSVGDIYAAMGGELKTTLLQLTFRVKDTVAPQSTVSVTVNQIGLTSADYEDITVDDLTWSATVSVPKSSDNTLKSLSVTGYAINFKPSTEKYYIEVPNDVTRVEINAEVNDPAARMEIKNISPLVAGESNRVRVVVTAENGSERTYSIYVTRKASETEPPKSSDNTLSSLTIAGVQIAFTPDKTQYTVTVESKVETLTITATPSDDGATVEIKNNQLTVGATTTVQVVVTAEDGTTRTYNLHVTRKAAETEPPITTGPIDTDPPPVSTGTGEGPGESEPQESTGTEVTPPGTEPGDDDGQSDQTIFWLNAIYIIILVGCLLVIAILVVLLIIYRRMNNNLRQ